MIDRMPQPALMGFAPDKTPYLIDLRRFYAPHFDCERVGITPRNDACVHRREGGRFLLTP